ncbi:MAG: TSUP family transporter [Clostridia bacterium]|nr:TSUP family transporter [Clostridia bacterium]
MNELWKQLLIVCPMVFLAGFADSVAGGGGIISIPAYLFAGLPVHMAYGTNKFAMSLGTAVSAVKYYRSGNVRVQSVLFAVLGALVGSNLGAQLALRFSERYLQLILMFLLPAVALFLFLNKGFGKEDVERPAVSKWREYVLSALIGLVVGAYDGFFGPGAGTFYTLLFVSLLHYSLITASGNARVVNLASNIGALAAFIVGGKVMFSVAVPAALCAVLGNYLGASLAIKNGAKFIRPIMVIVIALLIVKIITDML